jgi:hypothetical protein
MKKYKIQNRSQTKFSFLCTFKVSRAHWEGISHLSQLLAIYILATHALCFQNNIVSELHSYIWYINGHGMFAMRVGITSNHLKLIKAWRKFSYILRKN